MLRLDILSSCRAQIEQKGGGKMLRNIEAERVRNGFTKEELARKLKVSSKTYRNHKT